MSMNTGRPSRLSNDALETEVLRLARSERDSTASLVAHLAELYGRRLHERAGFSSLYTYCLEVLRLTEHEAYDRMKAAKVVRRFPHVLAGLASGELNLTTIRLLAPHLSRDNERDLFAAARGKRKRQVLELLALRFPKPDVASSVRRLPARPMLPVAAMPSPALSTTAGTPGDTPAGRPAAAVNPPAETRARVPVPASPPPVVRPLAPERHQFTFTASTQAREMFELARDLLRHSIPNGDPAPIFTRALELLVEDLLKKKFAVTGRPRERVVAAKDPRTLPAEVKRAVYLRDRGRCVFVGTRGGKCGERAFLEFDHHPVPLAAGGRSTVDNLELRCRAHNQYLAIEFLGQRVWADTARSGTVRHVRVQRTRE